MYIIALNLVHNHSKQNCEMPHDLVLSRDPVMSPTDFECLDPFLNFKFLESMLSILKLLWIPLSLSLFEFHHRLFYSWEGLTQIKIQCDLAPVSQKSHMTLHQLCSMIWWNFCHFSVQQFWTLCDADKVRKTQERCSRRSVLEKWRYSHRSLRKYHPLIPVRYKKQVVWHTQSGKQ